jgi:two-component system, chemotaxis family, chemotaxis protein CheY
MGRTSILLAEDHSDLRQLYTFMLTNDGFEVTAVKDGEEALAALLLQAPDVIVTDIEMPKMDGVELIKQVRSKPEFADLPVIAISAFGNGYLSRAAEAGATETLAKPVEHHELRSTVKRVLQELRAL